MVLIVCLYTPVAFGEERAPDITVAKSARFRKL